MTPAGGAAPAPRTPGRCSRACGHGAGLSPTHGPGSRRSIPAVSSHASRFLGERGPPANPPGRMLSAPLLLCFLPLPWPSQPSPCPPRLLNPFAHAPGRDPAPRPRLPATAPGPLCRIPVLPPGSALAPGPAPANIRGRRRLAPSPSWPRLPRDPHGPQLPPRWGMGLPAHHLPRGERGEAPGAGPRSLRHPRGGRSGHGGSRDAHSRRARGHRAAPVGAPGCDLCASTGACRGSPQCRAVPWLPA